MGPVRPFLYASKRNIARSFGRNVFVRSINDYSSRGGALRNLDADAEYLGELAPSTGEAARPADSDATIATGPGVGFDGEADCASSSTAEAEYVHPPVDLDIQAVEHAPRDIDADEVSQTEAECGKSHENAASLARVADEIRAQQMASACLRGKSLPDTLCSEDGSSVTADIGREQPLSLLGALPRQATPLMLGAITQSDRGLVRNIAVNLGRSEANYAAPALGADLNVRDRGAALTFAIPGTGLFYRVEVNSRRVQAFAPAAQARGRLGVLPGVLALSVAVFLSVWLLAGRGSPAGMPQLAAAELPTSVKAPPPSAAMPEASRMAAITPPPDKREERQVTALPPVVLTRATLSSAEAGPIGAAIVQAPSVVVPQPDAALPSQERVATNKTASIKVDPAAGAQVARLVPARVILTVFSKKDDWLEVGSTYAWGWVHASFVRRYDPRN
jgi:hypothetical protein